MAPSSSLMSPLPMKVVTVAMRVTTKMPKGAKSWAVPL
jgi:hypothetical protein